ncbi:hypothetical protein [Streptomyces sp. NPDC021356]|uniref:hypothetical protein n=1 Tax=Streptomyces sp. NPDC021356 TaxID=3154900 RepID=UPI0033CEECD3
MNRRTAPVDTLMGTLFEEITGEVRSAVRAVLADTDPRLALAARRAVSSGLDVLLAVPVKGHFVAAAQSAGGPVATQRARATDDLAAIVEAGRHAQGVEATPVSAQQARVAAIGAVGAALRIIDSRLGGEIDVRRDEAVTWSTAAALAVLAAVTSERP